MKRHALLQQQQQKSKKQTVQVFGGEAESNKWTKILINTLGWEHGNYGTLPLIPEIKKILIIIVEQTYQSQYPKK